MNLLPFEKVTNKNYQGNFPLSWNSDEPKIPPWPSIQPEFNEFSSSRTNSQTNEASPTHYPKPTSPFNSFNTTWIGSNSSWGKSEIPNKLSPYSRQLGVSQEAPRSVLQYPCRHDPHSSCSSFSTPEAHALQKGASSHPVLNGPRTNKNKLSTTTPWVSLLILLLLFPLSSLSSPTVIIIITIIVIQSLGDYRTEEEVQSPAMCFLRHA